MRIVPEVQQSDHYKNKLGIVEADSTQEFFGMFNPHFASDFRRAVIEYRIQNVLSEKPLDQATIQNSLNGLHTRTITKTLIPLLGAFVILLSFVKRHLADEGDQETLSSIVLMFLMLMMGPGIKLTDSKFISRTTDNLINSNLHETINDQNRLQIIELFELISKKMSNKISAQIEDLQFQLENPLLSPEHREDLQTKIADQVRQQQDLDAKLRNARINLLAKPNFDIKDEYLTTALQWKPEDLITYIEVQEDVVETSPERVITEVTQTVQATR
jgi:hypothetical protein